MFSESDDVVVTVPMPVWRDWLDEGNLPGEPWNGMESHFYLYGTIRSAPRMNVGNRVYVVAHGRLRGYAPIHRIEPIRKTKYALVRRGGAVAVTIDETITGFRGWRWRWWRREAERPFPEWETEGVQR